MNGNTTGSSERDQAIWILSRNEGANKCSQSTKEGSKDPVDSYPEGRPRGDLQDVHVTDDGPSSSRIIVPVSTSRSRRKKGR